MWELLLFIVEIPSAIMAAAEYWRLWLVAAITLPLVVFVFRFTPGPNFFGIAGAIAVGILGLFLAVTWQARVHVSSR